jgi:transposase-like protein
MAGSDLEPARKDQTTMSKTRRNHGSAFKAKVALEALKGEQTVAEIAAKLHPTLVTEWKRQLADGASSRKGPARPRRTARRRALQANRPAESGTFGTQALSRAERHPMIDRLNKHLSLTRQCQLLGLSRSSLYYQPATDNTEDLALMARIVPGDAVLRLAQDWLRREGHVVNRKRG